MRRSLLPFLVLVAACSSTEDVPGPGAGGSASGAGGSGSGAGGTGTGASPGEPVVLAEAEVPQSLAAQGSDVVWTDIHWEGSVRTAVVRRVPKAGGAVSLVAEVDDLIDFLGIVADERSIHWVGYGQTVPGAVFAAAASGLQPVVAFADQDAPIAIAQSGDALFWINLSPGAVMSNSGDTAVTVASDTQDSSSCVAAAAGGDVVWLSHDGNPRISRVASGSTALEVIVEGGDGGAIECLTADDEHVYFTRGGTSTGDFEPSYNHDGSVFRVPIGGGAPELLAADQERPDGIALRGDLVYWLNSDGSLARVPRAGGDIEVLVPAGDASDAPRTQTVVADAEGVYWISARKVWALLNP